MTDIIVRLRTLLPALSESERRVAEYALKNPSKFPYQSIYEIAESSEVSTASITRLVKKLDCDSLKDVKIRFAQNLDTALTAVFEGIDKKDTPDEIIRKVFGGNIRSLEDTLHVIDFDLLRKTADLILKSDRVYCAGIGSSGYIARDTVLRLSQLGINAAALADPFEAVVQAFTAGRNCLFIGISHSGRTKSTLHALRTAKKRGADTVTISNYPDSPLARAADIFLCTAFRETWTRAVAVSSRISQICLIDTLTVLVAREVVKHNKIDRINEVVEAEFRME